MQRCLTHRFLLFFWQKAFHKWSDKSWFLHHRWWRNGTYSTGSDYCMLLLWQRPRHEAEWWYNARFIGDTPRRLPSSLHTWPTCKNTAMQSKRPRKNKKTKPKNKYTKWHLVPTTVCHKCRGSGRKNQNCVLECVPVRRCSQKSPFGKQLVYLVHSCATGDKTSKLVYNNVTEVLDFITFCKVSTTNWEINIVHPKHATRCMMEFFDSLDWTHYVKHFWTQTASTGHTLQALMRLGGTGWCFREVVLNWWSLRGCSLSLPRSLPQPSNWQMKNPRPLLMWQ